MGARSKLGCLIKTLGGLLSGIAGPIRNRVHILGNQKRPPNKCGYALGGRLWKGLMAPKFRDERAMGNAERTAGSQTVQGTLNKRQDIV